MWLEGVGVGVRLSDNCSKTSVALEDVSLDLF